MKLFNLQHWTVLLATISILDSSLLAQQAPVKTAVPTPKPPAVPAVAPKPVVPTPKPPVVPAVVPKPATTNAPAKPAVPSAAAPAAAAIQKASPKATASVADTVIRLTKLKLSEASILSTVRTMLKNNPLKPDDVIKMAENGVSPSLIDALTIGASTIPTTASLASTSATPAKSATPVVSLAASALASFVTDFSTLSCETPNLQRKRVLAVDEFDFGTQKNAEQAILQTQAAIGTGMTALAVKRIQEANAYRVVERKGIKAILQEQDFGASNRAKQGTNARIGKIQGADAILMGTITVFGRDDKKTSIGAGALAPGLLGAVSFGKKEDKAVVAVAYRLVDSETSEVIQSGEARGESMRKSKGLALGGLGSGGGAAGGFDMTSSNFAQTIIGEATVDCMNKLIAILNANEPRVRRRTVELDTRIADIVGKQIYISSGSAESVAKCDKFEVSRIIKEVKDPVTKEILDLQLERVGEMMITEVRDKISIGVFNGTAMPDVGMSVKKILPPDPPAPPAPPPPPPPAPEEPKKKKK